MEYAVQFPTGSVRYLFGRELNLPEILPHSCCIITDQNLFRIYSEQLKDFPVLTIPAGEEHKSLEIVNHLAHELLSNEIHKRHHLLGFGGGMVTDITGFLASTYMRGISFSFAPTTLLSMVDAAIGGKNGVNVNHHKNIIGAIRQPENIFFDISLLSTLPDEEWSNGFAEIIKYGCMADARIITLVESESLAFFQHHPAQLEELIIGCADVKNKIVSADELEGGLRKCLNFGHTAAHAFERLYNLKHGTAVGLGMIVACMLSEKITGLETTFRPRLVKLLEQYGLKTSLEFSVDEVMKILRMDKKRKDDQIDFILLEKPGKCAIRPLSFLTIQSALEQFLDESTH